jgi:folate-dependent tRNA-U54 methylase TrmFO/GidA
MNEEEYKAFRRELTEAEEAEIHGFDDGNVFEGCMPIEVMARRGEDTMRYGPLKPVGPLTRGRGRSPMPWCSSDGTIRKGRYTTSWASRRISDSRSRSGCSQ